MSPSPAVPIIEARGLTRVHELASGPVRALYHVDLAVSTGELVAVMGPSGSGKTTLLRLLGGLDVPTAGDVVVDGHLLSTMNRNARAAMRRKRIGYVFQELNLLPTLTAAENVSLPLDLDGVQSAQARAHALELLQLVGLADLANRRPGELSGGQAQRVALARGLVGERRVLLADEPTGSLDSVAGEEIMRLLRNRVDAGVAGLVVTHDARLAAWADRTIFLRDGRLDGQSAGTGPESLLAQAWGNG